MKLLKKSAYFGFVAVYFLALIYLLFLKNHGIGSGGLSWVEYVKCSCNLIPFYDIYLMLTYPDRYAFKMEMQLYLFNFCGNVLMFVPLGALLYRWTGGSLKIVTFFAVTMITAVEMLQLFLCLGRFDVDDIIFGVIGIELGFLLAAAFLRAVGRLKKK